MKNHATRELRYWADVLAGDGETVLSTAGQIGAGVEDLSGRRLEQAQLISAETSHAIVMHYADALQVPNQGYVQITDPGSGAVTLYVVDYIQDPRKPRPRVWTEIYCHVERDNS